MPAFLEPAPAAAVLSADRSTDNSAGAENPQHVDNPDGAQSFETCLRDFLVALAEDHVSERTARLYVGHLARFAAWLCERYRANVLEATSHDVREYREQLAKRQRPASV